MANLSDLISNIKISEVEGLQTELNNRDNEVDASTSTKGIVELATIAETLAGTRDNVAVTPNALSAVIAGGSSSTVLYSGQSAAISTSYITINLSESLDNFNFLVITTWDNYNTAGHKTFVIPTSLLTTTQTTMLIRYSDQYIKFSHGTTTQLRVGCKLAGFPDYVAKVIGV